MMLSLRLWALGLKKPASAFLTALNQCQSSAFFQAVLLSRAMHLAAQVPELGFCRGGSPPRRPMVMRDARLPVDAPLADAPLRWSRRHLLRRLRLHTLPAALRVILPLPKCAPRARLRGEPQRTLPIGQIIYAKISKSFKKLQKETEMQVLQTEVRASILGSVGYKCCWEPEA